MILESLRKIVQEVNAAGDFQSALNLIVLRVREAMGTQVCSIYLRERSTGDLVFSATQGLNEDMVGQVSLPEGEGLVGMVARREEPLNIQNADEHPSFRLLPGVGEEKYQSFLGVPITHQRKVLGLLVVQQNKRRRFDDDEEAFLVTLSAQLAAVIAHAEATGAMGQVDEPVGTAIFHGVRGAAGVGIGEAVVVTPLAELDAG